MTDPGPGVTTPIERATVPKPHAKVSYLWKNNDTASRKSFSDVEEVLEADSDKVSLAGEELEELTVQPYTAHGETWLLRVNFHDGSEFRKDVPIEETDQDCKLVHDTTKTPPKTYLDCSGGQGPSTGWTLRVNTKKKVKPPDSLALQAAQDSADAAVACAKAAASALRALGAD